MKTSMTAPAEEPGASASTSAPEWNQVPGILARIKAPVFPVREFSILQFGAAGDGRSDCTEAIRLDPKYTRAHKSRGDVYMQKAVDDARAAFEKAGTAGAEWASPYEYHAAKEYLALAKEELDSGDTVGVAQFAAESERLSALAMQKTGEVPK